MIRERSTPFGHCATQLEQVVQNQIVELNTEFVIKAAGATYENGFGFELEISPEFVESVTGSVLASNMLSISSNGTESGQDKAVIMVFDNTFNVISRPAGYYVNTQTGAPFVEPDTLEIAIRFTEPLDPALVGAPPYNPFIFVNQDRMREVGAEIWQWLAEGAHFYVCGDAKRMAKDVEAALVEIVARHGLRTTDEAVSFVGSLKKSGRYQADVY